jgi:GT2 family glycosyltransferase
MARTAVVIVSYNSAAYLPRALESLERQTLPPDSVVVVDNASSDGSAELVEERFEHVEVMRMDRNAGFAPANNEGVRRAGDCDYIALLNPDAFPEPGWLEALGREAERRPEAGFLGARMMRAEAPDELDGAGDVYHRSGGAARRHWHEPLAAAPDALEPAETFSACAAAALYRRAAWEEVDGFDEDFESYYEDTDLAFRMRLAGWRGGYVPDAVVAHVGSAIAGLESDYSIYHIHRNLVWTWVKSMPWPLVLLYLPSHLAGNLAVVVDYARRGRAGVVLRAKRDALRALPRMLRKRRAIQRGRCVEARELRAFMIR